MSVRTSIVLVIALIMVAGYVLFVQVGRQPEADEEPPWFYNVDINDMTRIHIQDRGEEAVFFLDHGDRWRMDSPDGLPVGLDRWGGVTLLLSGPKTRRLLDEAPGDLAPYGLASPETTIAIDLKDGRTITVLLGLPTPDEVGFYGQIDGFPQLYTIVNSWKDVHTRLIHEPPFPEWYYDTTAEFLLEFRFETPDGVVFIVEGEEGWHLKDDETVPVEQEIVDELIAALERPEQALAAYGPADLEEFGLEEPAIEMLIRTTEVREDGVRYTSSTIMRFGDATEDGSAYYGQTQREEVILDIYTVNADWIEGIQSIVSRLPASGSDATGS